MGLAAAYLVLGHASILLAVPPTVASPVWPPAGLAIAGAIRYGPVALVGIFSGALLLEASVLGLPLPLNVAVALGMAVGVTAQAALAAWLLRRVRGPGNPLDHPGAVGPFIAIGGPFACTVSASVGTLALWLGAGLPRTELASTWLTWWVGDTVGVVFFAPILLAWCAEPAALWRRRRATVTVPLIGTFGLVLALYLDTSRREEARLREVFEDYASALATTLAHHLETDVALARAVQGLFLSSEEVTPEEFSRFAHITLGLAPGIEALGWAPVDPRTGAITLDYVTPLTGHEAAVGLDLTREPRRRAVVEAALETGEASASSAVRLVSDHRGAPSLLVVTPVLEESGPRGVVVAAIEVAELVDGALERFDRVGYGLRVFDVPTGELLYDSGPEPSWRAWTVEVPCADRSWRLEIRDTRPDGRSWLPWLVLVGGLLVAGLLVTLLIELVTRAVQVEALVAARTRELQHANAALLRSNTDLQRFAYVASHDLREPLRGLSSYAELLLEELGPRIDEEHRRRLVRVAENARRMQLLVSHLLELARAEGHAEPPRPADLGELARLALEDLGAAVEESGARVEIGPLPVVTCDRSEVASLFQNLFANSLKFRRPEVPPLIRVTARRTEGSWEISVADNGIGVPPEDRERVFEMFQRLHPRERYAGSGVGLAICRRIVERHGGQIWIADGPAPGADVRFTLAMPE